MILFLVVACTRTVIVADPDDSGAATDSGAEDSGSVLPGDTSDTGEEPEPEDTGWPKACADLYTQDEVVEFELDFEQADWAAINGDCQTGTQAYHPVRFTYAGETVEAHARLKGNWSWSCDKLQFVVSFNEDDEQGRFHGLRKLMLDAPWYDRTLLHERLAFPLFAARGLPYSCANNARVRVNGKYYGLYANLEHLDREYLERHFEEPEGNLYQGGSELKTNEDVGDTSRLAELQAARSVQGIDALSDLDEAVAEWAMEAMIPAMDNYWAGVEINYYLYDHPSRGFLWLPYDLDISFGDSAYTDGSLVWPDTVEADPITYEHYGWKKEVLLQTVLADPTWCARFVEELEAARAVYDPDALEARLDELDAQIADAYADDPNTFASASERARSVEQLRAFFQERADVVDAWLAEGGHCPGG